MPELPFLQVLIENLVPQVVGRTIRQIRLTSPSVLKSIDPPLAEAEGRTIEHVRRVGKLIALDLDGGRSLVFHLMRNGRLLLRDARLGMSRAARPAKDTAAVIRLDDGRELQFVEIGPKKRAALYVVATGQGESWEAIEPAGVDPLGSEFTIEHLTKILSSDSGQLKHVLTLQRYVAGIGNAFSDEILWEARLSPFVRASRVAPEEIAQLHGAIRTTLTRALEEHRTEFAGKLPMKEPVRLLRVHRHGGEPCPRCGTRIETVYYAEKETYYCPTCQTGGKVYADRRLSRLLK